MDQKYLIINFYFIQWIFITKVYKIQQKNLQKLQQVLILIFISWPLFTTAYDSIPMNKISQKLDLKNIEI